MTPYARGFVDKCAEIARARRHGAAGGCLSKQAAGISAPIIQAIIKAWAKENPDGGFDVSSTGRIIREAVRTLVNSQRASAGSDGAGAAIPTGRAQA